MNVQMKQPTKADRIRSVIETNPEFSISEIARVAGSTETYVRAVMHRRRHQTTSGRLASALAIAQRTYAEALRLRRESELSNRDQETYTRYCRAWDLHKAAEQVYVGLDRPVEVRQSNLSQPRGVPVRDLMARRAEQVPVLGKVR